MPLKLKNSWDQKTFQQEIDELKDLSQIVLVKERIENINFIVDKSEYLGQLAGLEKTIIDPTLR